MVLFYWNKSYETGFDSMDAQHKEFIELSDKLQNSVYDKKQADFQKYSDALLQNLNDHFNFEDELMVMHKFTGLFSHKAEHARFYEKVKKHLLGLNTKPTNDVNTFFETIEKWFVNHLELNDRPLAKFMLDNNLN